MADNEPFSFGKFIGGLIPGINTIKAAVSIWHVVMIIAFIVGCLFLWSKFTHKKMPELPRLEVATNNGSVHSSTDDNRKKLCFLSLCF